LKVAIAGLCVIVTHTLLMLGKAKLGTSPVPALSKSPDRAQLPTGEYVHPLVFLFISYINGRLQRLFLCQSLSASAA
jgi:hypothetical protein